MENNELWRKIKQLDNKAFNIVGNNVLDRLFKANYLNPSFDYPPYFMGSNKTALINSN